MEKLILPDIPDLHKIDVYEANGGYEMLRVARRSYRRGEEVQSSRPWRRMLPNWPKVDVHA